MYSIKRFVKYKKKTWKLCAGCGLNQFYGSLSSHLLVMTENNHITRQKMSSVDKYSSSITLNIKHDFQANIFRFFSSINHSYTLS